MVLEQFYKHIKSCRAFIYVRNFKKLFGYMERSKSSHSVTDYSISQTTLDDVFISFARRQGEGDDGEGAKETTL